MRAVVVLLACVFVLVACTQNESSKERIGIVAPLSGDYAFFGEDSRDALLLEPSEYEFIFEDDGSCNVAKGTSAVNKLVTVDKVNLIISTCTNIVEAAYPIAEEKNITYIQLFEGLLYKKDRLYQMLPFSLDLFTELGKQNALHESICVIQEEDVRNEQNAVYFIDGFQSTGGTVVLHERISPSETTFSTIIAKCEEKEGKAIVALVSPQAKGLFLKQFFAYESDLVLIGEINDELNLAMLAESVPLSLLEGLRITSFDMSGSETFREAFNVKYGRDPNLAGILAYDALGVAKQLQRSEENVVYEGALGVYAFDAFGVPHARVHVKELRNGTFQFITQ